MQDNSTLIMSEKILGLYLGGQGDLVSRLIMGIHGLTIWVIGDTNLLTKSP